MGREGNYEPHFDSRNRYRVAVARDEGLFSGFQRKSILEKELRSSYNIIRYHAQLGNDAAIKWHLEKISYVKALAKRNGWILRRGKYGR